MSDGEGPGAAKRRRAPSFTVSLELDEAWWPTEWDDRVDPFGGLEFIGEAPKVRGAFSGAIVSLFQRMDEAMDGNLLALQIVLTDDEDLFIVANASRKTYSRGFEACIPEVVVSDEEEVLRRSVGVRTPVVVELEAWGALGQKEMLECRGQSFFTVFASTT